MWKKAILGSGLALLGSLAACSGDSNQASPKGGEQAGSPNASDGDPMGAGGEGGMAGDTEAPDVGQLSALMWRASSCEDLADRVRQRLRDELAANIDLNVNPGTGGTGNGIGGSWGGSGFPSGGFAGGTWSSGGGSAGTGWVGSAGTGGGSASGGTGTGATGGDDAPPLFTGTNTQVPNVDEPDFVKTDGENLYVMQAGHLRVVRAYPAAELSEVASLEAEGQGLELFLAPAPGPDEKRLVVYSMLDSSQLVAAGASVAPGQPYVKVSVLGLRGSELTTLAEYFFEGGYLSARRTEQRVRQLLQVWRGYPEGLRTWATDADVRKAELLVLEQLSQSGRSVAAVPSAELDELYRQALADVLLAENEALLAGLRGEDFVPHAFMRQGGNLVAVDMSCDDVYVPASGTLDQSLTYVPELDLTALEAEPGGAAVLGGSQNLYQNGTTLVLASPPGWVADASGQPHTYLHVFDVDQEEPLAYRASGELEGSVNGQFALDEQGGDVRVVTSNFSPELGISSKLWVLQNEGVQLEVVGESAPIAPGETLRSVRFVGDTAYVVTFRNVDPLFVFDLTVPEAPQELGHLEIPGFSEYMHPVGDDRLITIGSSSGGWDANVVLRLFDVTDKAQPTLLASHEFVNWGDSAAQIDHRAFTYFAERKLLGIPFSGYAYDPTDYSYSFLNRLALVQVDLDQGFEELGAIDAAGLAGRLTDAGSCSWDPQGDARIERGTFIDDTGYAIARHGVVAAKLEAPSETIATLALGEACPGGYGGYGGYGIGGGGFAGGGFGGGSAGAPQGGFTSAGTSFGGVGGTGGGE